MKHLADFAKKTRNPRKFIPIRYIQKSPILLKMCIQDNFRVLNPMEAFIFYENDLLCLKMAIFVWSVKYTLVCKIHTCHVTSLMKVLINFYCLEVLWYQVTTSYDMWLLRFQGGGVQPPHAIRAWRRRMLTKG